MSAILGATLDTPRGHEGLAFTTCRYEPAGGSSPIYAEVTIEWRAGEAAMRDARLAQRSLENVADASTSGVLIGLGDDATMIVGSILMVRTGQTVITIDVQMPADVREKGTNIARKLLERIAPV